MTSENQYKAKDEYGNDVEFAFHLSAYPGQEMLVVIIETRL